MKYVRGGFVVGNNLGSDFVATKTVIPGIFLARPLVLLITVKNLHAASPHARHA